MTLKETIKQLPTSPGVYQYYDASGKLLYIGKAKSLKKRVKSYFNYTPVFRPADKLSPRISKMLHETVNLEYILVSTEHEALILENSLIKQLKPKYNILLRDDKTYPYIYIDAGEKFPRFEITRKVKKQAHIKYFGPFTQGASDILDALYEIYPLVQKKSCVKGGKACLYYQIERCLAPCEGKIDEAQYGEILQKAYKSLNNRSQIVSFLQERMEAMAERLLFEEAAKLRDKMTRVEKTLVLGNIDIAKAEDFDLLAHYKLGTKMCVVRLFLREGKVVSTSHNILKSDFDIDADEVYKRSLMGFYTDEYPMMVNRIYLLEDFESRQELEQLLKSRFDKKVELIVPQRGEKRKLCEIAALNAKELLVQNSKTGVDELLEDIKHTFGLKQTPYRAEGYDNSHISGTAIVGACVVWQDGWDKGSYRHYNLTHRDDYHQMKEMLGKRCDSFESNPAPNLWVIDGGEALRRLAVDVAESFGVELDVVAIAKEKINAKANRSKGGANDILYTAKGEFKLGAHDKRLHFFQRLRDESHRFVIAYHRNKKRGEDKQIELLKADGIGEGTVKKLLDFFGTFEAIKNASHDELAQVIDKKAKALREFYAR